jgi:hypothetical protein
MAREANGQKYNCDEPTTHVCHYARRLTDWRLSCPPDDWEAGTAVVDAKAYHGWLNGAVAGQLQPLVRR